MPQHSNKRRVRHAAGQMFDLVADIERYPEFVPLCRSLKVRQRKPAADGVEVLVADMTAAYKLISEQFTSRVTDRQSADPVEYLMARSAVSGTWTFGRRGICDVEFFISYEFKSRMLALLMGSMFDLAFRRFAAAFEERADRVYTG